MSNSDLVNVKSSFLAGFAWLCMSSLGSLSNIAGFAWLCMSSLGSLSNKHNQITDYRKSIVRNVLKPDLNRISNGSFAGVHMNYKHSFTDSFSQSYL